MDNAILYSGLKAAARQQLPSLRKTDGTRFLTDQVSKATDQVSKATDKVKS